MADECCVEDFEYVTQFFGFTPKSFTDGVFNAINDYLQECFKEMGRIFEEEFAKKDEKSSSQIREGCKDVIGRCYSNLDWVIDKMELYMLKNIFMIPSSVLLPEDHVHEQMKGDFGQSLGARTAGQYQLDKEIVELKDKIRKEIMFKKMMQAQQEKLKKVLENRKMLENWFIEVNKEITEKKIEECISFVCQNSLELKDIVQQQRQMTTTE